MRQIKLSAAHRTLHHDALAAAVAYRKSEWRLIEILNQIDQTKLFKRLGYTSLFQYAVDALKLSESSAYAMITVARKASDVPALGEAIKSHKLSVSKASRLAVCLNQKNASELIDFAKSHTMREIDFEVAKRNPKASKHESIRPESEDRVRIAFSASRALLEKTKRAQDVLAQKGKATDFEAVFDSALNEYLRRHDPVEKAKRALENVDRKRSKDEGAKSYGPSFQGVEDYGPSSEAPKSHETSSEDSSPKGNSKTSSQTLCKQSSGADSPQVAAGSNTSPIYDRTPTTAFETHVVMARDEGRCTFIDKTGRRCTNERYLHVHHIHPVSLGGSNDPDKLTILCSAHHELVHQLSLPIDGQVSWLRSPQAVYNVSDYTTGERLRTPWANFVM